MNPGGGDIYSAAALGDHAAIRRFLDLDPAAATAKGAPSGWDALTCLCFSPHLRDPARSDAFVRAAQLLLDAGADPNTGYFESGHQPKPVFESVLYGAAGIAHHEPLTRLLLERGADPNDEEVPYHSPEGYDNAALQVLVESGRLTDASLATMLLRKHDWHDREGVDFLLARGADPNRNTPWGRTATQQALLRDNALPIFESLLNHGARLAPELAFAARRGRGDVLDLCEQRGVPVELEGVDRLLAACARGRDAEVRAIAHEHPGALAELRAQGGSLLAAFAGNDNAAGTRLLLDLGVPVAALFMAGDGYWDIAPSSTALHVAAWRASHDTVKLLIERGVPVDTPDGKGRTPLVLAVRASVDSHWTHRRSPVSVAALLHAGASAASIPLPTGYTAIDPLLAAAGRNPSPPVL